MPSDTALTLRDSVVLFGQFPALAGVTMEARQGEIIMIAGTNGAGKTTLLRLLAGLTRMTKGSGEVLGIDLASKNLEDLHKRVGLVGNHSMLYEDLTIMENLKFWRASTSADEVANVLDYLGLPQASWKLPIRKLSTGQKRRAVLAHQILKRPSLWLLDEPHAGLDKAGRELLDEIIKNASEHGATVLFTSHETHHAHLANRQLELKGGRFI